jgi:hypothetical protein
MNLHYTRFAILTAITSICIAIMPLHAQFQRQYGTALNESFGKVIPHGSDYYVLGQAEATAGQALRATVSRINASGQLQWTRRLDVASQWNDAVLTPSGNLFLVGHTLPLDVNSQSLMGVITPAGTFNWLRNYNATGRESFNRVVRNPVPNNAASPYYVLGFQQEPSAVLNWDDVVLLTVSEAGSIGWEKIYSGVFGSTDDEFVRDMEALPNGDLLLAGNWGNSGAIFRADNAGAIIGGVSPDGIQMTFADVAQAGSNFIAAGFQFPSFSARLMKFDPDLITLWQVSLPGLTAIRNVWTSGSSIFVSGSATVEGFNRGVVLKFQDGVNGPALQWMKYLQGDETSHTGGTAWPVPAGMAFCDGRNTTEERAFMSVSDLEMNTCMTQTSTTSVTNTAHTFNGPCCLNIDFTDALPGMNAASSLVTWQQAEACPDPINASIIGVKYRECNGLPYSNQTPIAGWTIQLLNSMGTIIGEQVTGADGSYAFTDLPLGQYLVKEIAQPGWTPNVPPTGQLAVTLAASEQRIVNFGNCPPPQLACACQAGNQPGNNLAANANFSGGNTGFSSGYTFSNSSPLQPGQYWVGSNPSQINAGFTSCGDHTTGSGNMLVVNGGASTSTPVWCQTYTVVPNSTYLFEAWVASLTSASPANLMLFVNNVSYGAGFFASSTSCNWEKYCTLWESGTNTSVTLCLVDLNTAGTGNDFALDDISFKRCIAPFGGITGTVYQVCDSLPFTDQPVLPGWTVQLLDDTETTVLAEQVTDANGEYAFADLPYGLYYCRVVNQPGWTPKVPVSGEYIINLDAPGQVVRDFGMCPECSCDSIFTYIHQEFGTSDTSTYQLSIFNNGIDCFPYLDVAVDTGMLIGWTDILTGWEVILINAQTLRLIPPNGNIPEGYFLPARLIIAGDGTHSIRTMTAVMGLACTAGPERAFQSPPIFPGSSCCPSGWTAGPEMVTNGEFNLPVLPSSDYSPRVGSMSPGEIDIMDQSQAPAANINWVCPGKTGVTDKYLAVDGSGVPMAAAWKQQINLAQLTADRNYVFCFQTSNMVKIAKSPYADPRLFMQIEDDTNPANVWTGGPYIIPESPKVWVPISMNWTAPANLSASYTLKIFTTPYNTDFPGNDFALDGISFRECIPPCTASITTTNIDNCGHVQLNAVASGLSDYSYQWCSGESTAMIDRILPCGSHDFCVSITCADGSVASATTTVVVNDNIPPTINCPQDMTFTALAPNCDMPVFGIHSLGAGDNCGTPTVTYAITGATTASGTGDASGTTFNSGTSTVTYTATDWCNNMTSCSFDVTIDCDTCACLGFQNLEFYNFLNGPNLPVFCDSTSVMLPCIGPDALYWLQWGLLCSDPLCQQSYSYSIVPASGGPALLSGTVPLGSPPFLSFSYNQLSGPGNYQIILTGHCGTDSCVCHINFSIPTCCECGGFSGMTYRPTQGIMNLPFMCGDTMGVDCNQTFLPQVGGLFQCVGSSCPNNNPIQWVLSDPQGNVIQSSPNPVSANPGFGFTLNPTWFVQPGTYALTMTGKCGGVACDSCVLYLESLGCTSPGDSCCFEWVSTFVGNLGEVARDVVVDGSGNSYTIGYYSGTVDFDPGAGVLNLTSNGGNDIYISKLDPSGNLVWVQTFGGTSADHGYGITTDALGDIYATGSFIGTVDFDPGSGVFNMTTTGSDMFVIKIDNVGNFVWAKQFGGATSNFVTSESITLDAAGNIYLAGDFNGTVDFDPGIGVFAFTGNDMFTCKLDPSGGLIWAKQFIINTPFKKNEAVAVDPTGNVYFTGYFGSSVDFDPGPGIFNLTPVSGADIFICKLDNAGNFVDVYHLTGTFAKSTYDIVSDGSGNIFVTGYHFGTTDFDPGPGVFSLTAPNLSAFVARYDPAGNLVWAKSYDSTNNGVGFSIALDGQSNVYTSGRMTGTIDFDPGAGVYNLTSIGIQDGYIAKLDAAGNFMWAKALHSTQVTLGNAVAVDGQGNVYTAGNFRGTTDFDPGTNVFNVGTASPVSAYVHKLGMCLPDTCQCGGFTDMFIRGPQGLMSRPAVCGGPPVGLGCASSGNGYMFTGIFQCDGTACPDSSDIHWDLLGPNGSGIASGMITSNPLFGLPLLASYFAQPGVYTLNLTGYCGSDTCTCTITLLVPECPDPCPCDLPTLISDVNQGFADAYSTTSCRVCFTPLGLSDCDDVEWMINSPINPPVGTSLGNQTFCHTFPSSGTYTVYMTVLRRRSDGSLCESWVYSRTIMVKCTKQAECETSVYPNPTFEEGAVLGSFLEDGTTAGWTRVWGDPHVDERDGSKVIKKRGNFNSADVTGTIEPVCLAKDTGTISLRFGIKERGIRSAIVVQLFSGDNYELGVCESADCYEVARIELPDSDNPEEEFEVEIPYDISGWDATATCGDQPGVRVRPAIYVTGPFSDEQGPGSLTIIDLDYFCVDGQLLTGTQNPDQAHTLRLFPNPTSHTFTLELPEPATPGTSFRIAGITGQTLLQQRAEAGSRLQVFDLSALPAGMYFVQVWQEGSVVGVGRVVRQ